MSFRRCVSSMLPAIVMMAVAVLISVRSTRATDPEPPPPAPATLLREPAFNPAAPLLGRVTLLDDTGVAIHHWTSPQPNDMFGLAAIVLPDVNGDGIADVAIAAPNAFDDAAGARVGAVTVFSGADGSSITTVTGTPLDRFGLALFAAPAEAPAQGVILTVLVELLDPNTNHPYSPSAFTFESFDAFTGAFVAEAVEAPAGFTAQAAIDSLATNIRATGPADLDADGTVSPADLSILASTYGTTIDPPTGELLLQNPTLAATIPGDTNGDGVVDSTDLNTVITSFGVHHEPGFEFVGDPLTEAEASVVEDAFGQAMSNGLDCHHCALCDRGWCQVLPDRYDEVDGDDPPMAAQAFVLVVQHDAVDDATRDVLDLEIRGWIPGLQLAAIGAIRSMPDPDKSRRFGEVVRVTIGVALDRYAVGAGREQLTLVDWSILALSRMGNSHAIADAKAVIQRMPESSGAWIVLVGPHAIGDEERVIAQSILNDDTQRVPLRVLAALACGSAHPEAQAYVESVVNGIVDEFGEKTLMDIISISMLAQEGDPARQTCVECLRNAQPVLSYMSLVKDGSLNGTLRRCCGAQNEMVRDMARYAIASNSPQLVLEEPACIADADMLLQTAAGAAVLHPEMLNSLEQRFGTNELAAAMQSVRTPDGGIVLGRSGPPMPMTQ